MIETGSDLSVEDPPTQLKALPTFFQGMRHRASSPTHSGWWREMASHHFHDRQPHHSGHDVHDLDHGHRGRPRLRYSHFRRAKA